MPSRERLAEFVERHSFVGLLVDKDVGPRLVAKPASVATYEWMRETIGTFDRIELSSDPAIDVWVDDEGLFRPEEDSNPFLRALVARMLDVDLEGIIPLRGPGLVTGFSKQGETTTFHLEWLELLGYGITSIKLVEPTERVV